MVGISGVRNRQVELVRKDGYEVVVFGGWPNWEEYYEKYVNLAIHDKDGYVNYLYPQYQWQWPQNYPELVVEDVVKEFEYLKRISDDDRRDWLYGDLLYRGVNKWLMVRYLLVRYKKWVAEERNKAWNEYSRNRDVVGLFGGARYQLVDDWGKAKYWEGYWKGYYDAMWQVRADLKTMAMTPRYVIWNNDRPGIVVDRKISRGWLELVKRLYDVRFEK